MVAIVEGVVVAVIVNVIIIIVLVMIPVGMLYLLLLGLPYLLAAGAPGGGALAAGVPAHLPGRWLRDGAVGVVEDGRELARP